MPDDCCNAYVRRPNPNLAYRNLAELLRLVGVMTGAVPSSGSPAAITTTMVGAADTLTLNAGEWRSVQITNFDAATAATVNGEPLPAKGYVSYSMPIGVSAPALEITGVGGVGSEVVRVDVMNW